MPSPFRQTRRSTQSGPPSTPRRWSARSRELLSAPHHFEFGAVIFLYVILKLFTLSPRCSGCRSKQQTTWATTWAQNFELQDTHHGRGGAQQEADHTSHRHLHVPDAVPRVAAKLCRMAVRTHFTSAQHARRGLRELHTFATSRQPPSSSLQALAGYHRRRCWPYYV